MPHTEHKQNAPEKVNCAILTISDTRTQNTDETGKLIMQKLQACGHEVKFYEILSDSLPLIASVLKHLIMGNVDVIITNGGTGVSKRDVTYEAVQKVLTKEITGFGELFRMLSYQEIGSSAMMSRAIAGVAKGTVIISIPGSIYAAELAMDKLILPELGHLVYEANR
jgi:molybdenum cofactor biosynthesis protein B